jgi:uncharacterized protein YndB with AHSA1/START domain
MSAKTESFELSVELPVTAKRLYKAWLNGKEHSAFTGARATVVPKVGGRHTAWDGYIEGVTLELEPHRRIVQSWRTSEFPEGSEDSRLELLLEETSGGPGSPCDTASSQRVRARSTARGGRNRISIQ